MRLPCILLLLASLCFELGAHAAGPSTATWHNNGTTTLYYRYRYTFTVNLPTWIYGWGGNNTLYAGTSSTPLPFSDTYPEEIETQWTTGAPDWTYYGDEQKHMDPGQAVDFYSSGPPPPNTNWVACVDMPNPWPFAMGFVPTVLGQGGNITVGPILRQLPTVIVPAESTNHFCVTNGVPFILHVDWIPPGTDGQSAETDSNPDIYATNSPPVPVGTNAPVQGPNEPPPTRDFTAPPGTQANPSPGPMANPLQGTTNPASIQGQQATINTLAVNGALGRVDDASLLAQVKAGGNTLQGMSNLLSGMATNTASAGATEATLRALTNQLSNTNAPMSGTISDLAGAGTNIANASNQVSVIFTQPMGDVGSFTAGLEGVKTDWQPTAEPSGFVIPFCGTNTLDLYPERLIPNLANAIFYALTAILLLKWALYVAECYGQAVQTFASVSTGGVPDLETSARGTGGNLLGVIIAVAVPALLCGVWSIAVLSATSWLTNRVTGQGAALAQGITMIDTYLSNSFNAIQGAIYGQGVPGQPGQMAWHLMTKYLPVNMAIATAVSKPILKATMNKAILVAVGITKFLWGK
jgi:hypothetical protein